MIIHLTGHLNGFALRFDNGELLGVFRTFDEAADAKRTAERLVR